MLLCSAYQEEKTTSICVVVKLQITHHKTEKTQWPNIFLHFFFFPKCRIQQILLSTKLQVLCFREYNHSEARALTSCTWWCMCYHTHNMAFTQLQFSEQWLVCDDKFYSSKKILLPPRAKQHLKRFCFSKHNFLGGNATNHCKCFITN